MAMAPITPSLTAPAVWTTTTGPAGPWTKSVAKSSDPAVEVGWFAGTHCNTIPR